MQENFIDELNPEQQAPAIIVDGAVLVTAGAGSGKTRLLTHRIANLVTNHNIQPYNILAITFTNKAANEMKERLSKLVNGSENMWICTFHAMCSKILRVNASKLGFGSNFTVYGDSEKERVIKRLLNDHPDYNKQDKNSIKPESIIWHISTAKNELMEPEEYHKHIKYDKNARIIIDVYSAYQQQLKLSNAMDFDDMIMLTYKLLSTDSDTLEYYQNKFKYILIDEFQDTNTAQYDIVSLLAKKYGNIFAVGDEDQCIYSWRGAKFTNVQKFIDDNPGVSVFKLEQNYRSTPTILSTANLIISNNKNRISKNLWSKKEDGDKINYICGYNDGEEAEYVAQKIKALVSEGYDYKDFAILMRINSLSRIIEEKFLNYQIPYQVYGGFKFFERKEVKDVLAYLKVVSNPSDNDSFVRVLGFPKKGIGDSTVTKILNASKEYGISAFDICKNRVGLDANTVKKVDYIVNLLQKFIELKESLNISDLFNKIIDEADIKTSFSSLLEEDITRLKNIEDLQKSVAEYEEVNDEPLLEDYLQSITLARDIDSMDNEENYVSVMTIHSAKGLEFKVVFIIGLNEGILPLSKAVNSNDPNQLEEERRLMYVATTRAMEKLFYTRSSTKFDFETKRTEATTMSRFLKESNIEAIKNHRNDNFSQNYEVKRASRTLDYYNDLYEDDRDTVEQKVDNSKLDFYKQFAPGVSVMHRTFGEGVVKIGVTDPVGAFVTVDFKSVGVKTLSLKFAPLEIKK